MSCSVWVANAILEGSQVHQSSEVVYFNEISFLNIIDDHTNEFKVGAVGTRRLQNSIDVIAQISCIAMDYLIVFTEIHSFTNLSLVDSVPR